MSAFSTLTRPSHRRAGRPRGSKNSSLRDTREVGEVWTLEALAARSITDVNDQGCWEWTGGMASSTSWERPRVNLADCDRQRGLGRHASSKRITVALLICQLRGDDTSLPDYEAQHLCDNGWCVNPDHIWWGPTQQNIEDRLNRPQGWVSVRYRLSVPQLRTIYWLYCSTLPSREIHQRVGLKSSDALRRIAQLEQKTIARYFAGDGPSQNSDLA